MRGSSRVAEDAGRRSGILRPPAAALACALLAAALLASGCGAGKGQDAQEPAGFYRVQVLRASFPARQSVARATTLELQVRNSGSRTLPNLAVALNSLNYTEHFPELAANKRPVWVIERGPGEIANPPVESQEVSPPGGAQTVYVNTWALGPLAPGRTQTFRWRLMPVKPGAHGVNYAIFAGLAGKARARLASGGPARGRFAVYIAPAPAPNHVEPSTGRVAPGPYPAAP